MSYDLTKLDRQSDFDIGICYYDPLKESLIEVGHNSGNILGADPYSHVMHKFVLVTGTTNRITKVGIRVVESDKIRDLFDIKVQFSNSRPSLMSFQELSNYNTIEIETNVEPNSIIPFYIYIKANSDVTSITHLPIEVYYDYI